jgi:hypothetical protein
MEHEDGVQALIARAGKLAECKAKRADWARETAAACRAAQRAMDDRCGAAVTRMSEEAFHRLLDEEQAKVDALYGPLRAAAERDRWPRELYWGGI